MIEVKISLGIAYIIVVRDTNDSSLNQSTKQVHLNLAKSKLPHSLILRLENLSKDEKVVETHPFDVDETTAFNPTTKPILLPS
jgi:hypothetical protein